MLHRKERKLRGPHWVTKRHAGCLAGSSEVPQIPDGMVAVQRTGNPSHEDAWWCLTGTVEIHQKAEGVTAPPKSSEVCHNPMDRQQKIRPLT